MQSRFGGAGETSVHPVVAGAMLLIAVLIFVLPRRQVIVPFLAAAFLIPMDQVILIGAFHFQMLRLLILFGWIRLIRDKFSSDCTILSHGANWIDRTVGLWVISGAITFVLLWQESGAIINQLGTIYTAFGIYFLLRFLIRDTEDAKRAIRAFAYIAAVVAVIMSIEQATGRNPYAVIGGSRVADRQMLMEREDRFRAEASFGHPILAGTFGGISLPLYLALSWKDKQSRKALLVGVMATTVIVLASNSSTSMLAYGAGLLALGLWPVRRWMRAIRWGLLATLVTLHLTMKAPVWALIARIDLTGGSSSYHRYQLVDLFIRRFWDWWLIGVKNNADWGWMMWDLANQYVSIRQTSGFLPFICFLWPVRRQKETRPGPWPTRSCPLPWGP